MHSEEPEGPPAARQERTAAPELSVIQRCYDLILWLQPRVQKLPREARFGLGVRIETALYELLELLIEARYAPPATEALRLAGVRVERLRYQMRLLRDLGYLDARRAEHGARLLLEVGQEIGGWLKYRQRKGHEARRQPVSRDRELGESGTGRDARPPRETVPPANPFV